MLTTSLIPILSDSETVNMALIMFFSQSDTLMLGGNDISFFMRSINTCRWSVFYQGNKLYRIL